LSEQLLRQISASSQYKQQQLHTHNYNYFFYSQLILAGNYQLMQNYLSKLHWMS